MELFRIYDKPELAFSGYPLAWPEISAAVKAEANLNCENCGHGRDQVQGRVLTTHHLNGDKADCRRENLAALCQVCHLRLQGSGTCPPYFPREQRRLF